jgi:hypothetical protein
VAPYDSSYRKAWNVNVYKTLIIQVDDENLPDDFVYVSNNLESKSEGFDRSTTVSSF